MVSKQQLSTVSFYEEHEPLEGRLYKFGGGSLKKKKKKKKKQQQQGEVKAFVAAYNEEAFAVEKTVRSLREQGIPALKILVVFDGLAMMDSSAKLWVRANFGSEAPVEHRNWPSKAETAIVSRPGGFAVLLKRRNRRKPNSMEWFLRSFARGSAFAFLTDCGTTFEPDCLRRLIGFMKANPTCNATTGRKRGMTLEEQAAHEPGRLGEPASSTALRAIQDYLFEDENAGWLAVSDTLNQLVCCHGPCMCLRYAGVVDPAFVKGFFGQVSDNATEAGMIGMQLQLGEDRLLTLYAKFRSSVDDASVKMVSGARFNFDPEVTLERLVKQRRRWINNGAAGPLYILFRVLPELWRGRKNIKSIRATTRIAVCAMLNASVLGEFLTAQCRTFLVGWLSRYAWLGLAARFGTGQACRERAYAAQLGFVVLYSVLTAAFVWVHVKRKDDSRDNSFSAPLWAACIALNSATTAVSVLLGLLVLLIPTQQGCLETCHASQVQFHFLLTVMLLVSLQPFLTAVLEDRVVLRKLVRPRNVASVILAATCSNLLWLYSLARFADLTWGNRKGVDVLTKKALSFRNKISVVLGSSSRALGLSSKGLFPVIASPRFARRSFDRSTSLCTASSTSRSTITSNGSSKSSVSGDSGDDEDVEQPKRKHAGNSRPRFHLSTIFDKEEVFIQLSDDEDEIQSRDIFNNSRRRQRDARSPVASSRDLTDVYRVSIHEEVKDKGVVSLRRGDPAAVREEVREEDKQRDWLHSQIKLWTVVNGAVLLLNVGPLLALAIVAEDVGPGKCPSSCHTVGLDCLATWFLRVILAPQCVLKVAALVIIIANLFKKAPNVEPPSSDDMEISSEQPDAPPHQPRHAASSEDDTPPTFLLPTSLQTRMASIEEGLHDDGSLQEEDSQRSLRLCSLQGDESTRSLLQGDVSRVSFQEVDDSKEEVQTLFSEPKPPEGLAKLHEALEEQAAAAS